MSLDPELAAALEFLPPPPPADDGVSPAECARSYIKLMLVPFKDYYGERLPAESQYDICERRVLVKDGEITIRVLTPTTEKRDTFPVLVWYHGGGWMLGDLDMDDCYLRILCVELRLVIVNVDYRLVPEHRFPTAFSDCYAALRWVADNAKELNINVEQGFLVGGDSAGGGLAAAVALQARDDPFFHGRGLTGQFLREPMTCHPDAYPEKYKAALHSFAECKEAPILDSDSTLSYYNEYLDGAPPSDMRISPLAALTHTGLPPTFIQVQDIDPLRDEGLVYEKALREAGVKTKLVRYNGTLHGTHYLFPTLPVALRFESDGRDGLRWLLAQSASC